MKSKIISLRIPESVLESIDELAAVEFPSRKPDVSGNRSQMILKALDAYLYQYYGSK